MKIKKTGVSAGGVVLRKENDKWMIVLENEEGLEKEYWFLPKGHVEHGEDLEMAARREVEEEVGVSELKLVDYLGLKERMTLKGNEWLTIHYFLFLTEQNELHRTATDKKHFSKWFDLFSDDYLLYFDEQKEIVEKAKQIILEKYI